VKCRVAESDRGTEKKTPKLLRKWEGASPAVVNWRLDKATAKTEFDNLIAAANHFAAFLINKMDQ